LNELNLLMDFQDVMGFGSYSPGFGLTDFGDLFELETQWSAQPAFLDRLIPFARADEAGSFYALWRVDDFTELSRMPVIVFGARGGVHVVAADIRALLRLLALSPSLRIDEERVSFSCEAHPAVETVPPDGTSDDGATVYNVCTERVTTGPYHPARHADYVEWLEEVLGLAPVADCTIPVSEAQTIFAEPFRQWVTPYVFSAHEF
jgi:hypothetical protein